MKKIFFPIKFFYPFQKGGYAISTYNLAKNLAKKGFEISVITSDKGIKDKNLSNSWTTIDGVQIKYCSSPTIIKILINSITKINKSDIIHLTSIFFIPSYILALYSIIQRKKIVWSSRGELSKEAIAGNRLKICYLNLIKTIKKNIIFHSTSKKETEEIQHFFGKECKIKEIPNYMEIREPLYRDKEKSIVFVGRIDPIKALDKLINAVALSKIFIKENYKLYLIGDDKDPSTLWYVKELKELITKLNLEDKVIFLGNVYGDRKYEYYSKSKCSLLVSETENFGNVVIESLSQGTPVISSLGTPWAVLKKENMGDFVSNEPYSISIALDKLLTLPQEDYNVMSKKCIKWSYENFSFEHHINDWIDCYNNL